MKYSKVHWLFWLKKEFLLDYEVELAVVYSKDVKRADDINNQLLGFMVVMDYSDRESQLRDYDTDHPELAVGFTDSKSHETFFPVGAILVIPKDWKNKNKTYYSTYIKYFFVYSHLM